MSNDNKLLTEDIENIRNEEMSPCIWVTSLLICTIIITRLLVASKRKCKHKIDAPERKQHLLITGFNLVLQHAV